MLSQDYGRTPMKKLIFFAVFSLSISSLAACSTGLFHPTGPSSNETQPTSNAMAMPPPADGTSLGLQGPSVGATDTKPGFSEPTPVVPSSTTLAGDIQVVMSKEDKSKLSHALDKALGKSTEWTNELTHISYTVVPTKKVMVNDNHFCRKYTITATKNESSKEISGTACVSEDGEWHEVTSRTGDS